jgi:hypothetical protein
MTKFTYKLIKSIDPITNETIANVLRSDGALIPTDLANSDYQEYLAENQDEMLKQQSAE